jgi:ABC-type hemin transport system substrate-binding protein
MADTHILTEEAANQLQDQLQANLEASQALTAKHRKKRVLYNAVRSCIHNLY